MAQQIINNGSSAGDPTAEDIFTAFGKTKSNFSELYNAITTFVLKAGDVLTGVLQFANGTAASPSLKIGSDQKGLYHINTNQLGVSVNGTNVSEFNSNGLVTQLNRLIIQDRKSVGTSGGASVSGDNDRDLNTVLVNTITEASVGSNQFTLPVGRYYIEEISTPAFSAYTHKCRLYNVTTSTNQTDINSNIIVGTSGYSDLSIATRSTIKGYYFDVVSTPKVFKIIHGILNADANGLGFATSLTYEEIYTTVSIVKVQ
jgi:hypothetical protein